jgi:hypothetical protein
LFSLKAIESGGNWRLQEENSETVADGGRVHSTSTKGGLCNEESQVSFGGRTKEKPRFEEGNQHFEANPAQEARSQVW